MRARHGSAGSTFRRMWYLVIIDMACAISSTSMSGEVSHARHAMSSHRKSNSKLSKRCLANETAGRSKDLSMVGGRIGPGQLGERLSR